MPRNRVAAAPGRKKKSEHKCSYCSKTVSKHCKAICCDVCLTWSHITCIGIPDSVYDFISNSDVGSGFIWTCDVCRVEGYELRPKQKITKGAPALTELKSAIQSEVKDMLPNIIKSVIKETKPCLPVIGNISDSPNATETEIIDTSSNNEILEKAIKSTAEKAL